jgi:hypothetical protein
MRPQTPVPSSITDLELRLADVQAQLDRLSHAADKRAVPVEERLAALADQYDAYLKRWALAIEWHTRAVTQLESHVNEWKDTASRVQEDAADRLQHLEGVVDREWTALRKVHELPVAELRQQAASLTEVCIATASAAQQGFDRAEARLAAFEADFHRTINEVTRELHAALVEIRSRSAPQLAGSQRTAAWSFEDVTRLHGQLRGSPAPQSAADPVHMSASLLPPAAVIDTPPSEPVPSPSRSWIPAIAASVLVLVIVAVGAWYLRKEVRASTARVQQAETTAQQAVSEAARRADTARTEAAREIAGAREVAARAQRIGEIVAAPDLVRLPLVSGSETATTSGRALWSRSSGLLLTASHVPPPPPGGAHVSWLFTRSGPVRAGALTVESDGTATLVKPPIEIRRAVIGIAVTAETNADIDRPSGTVILTSVQPATSATPAPAVSQE